MKFDLHRSLIPSGFLTALAALALCASAHGQADLSFSGGNGNPLELTIDAPITYTITATGSQAPLFVFDGTTALDNFAGGASGALDYTVNGGSPLALNIMVASYKGGDIKGNLYLYDSNALTTLSAGDVVTLDAGTLTSDNSVTAAPLAAGSYATFVTDGNVGYRISGGGASAVPEPSTWAMMLGGLGMLGGVQRLRRPRRA